MSLDVTIDPVLEAIGSLVAAHVNAELQSTLGESAIAKAYRHPTPLRILSAIAMPSLSISRGEQRTRRRTSGRTEELVQVLFTYVTPPTALDRLELRWPLLEHVWRRTVDAMFAGRSAHYLSGADVFCAAGVTEVVESSPVKRELYADDGSGTAYPAFEGRIDIWARQLSAVEYDDLTGILATYNLVGTVGTDVRGFVRDEITFTAPVFEDEESLNDNGDPVIDG